MMKELRIGQRFQGIVMSSVLSPLSFKNYKELTKGDSIYPGRKEFRWYVLMIERLSKELEWQW